MMMEREDALFAPLPLRWLSPTSSLRTPSCFLLLPPPLPPRPRRRRRVRLRRCDVDFFRPIDKVVAFSDLPLSVSSTASKTASLLLNVIAHGTASLSLPLSSSFFLLFLCRLFFTLFRTLRSLFSLWRPPYYPILSLFLPLLHLLNSHLLLSFTLIDHFPIQKRKSGPRSGSRLPPPLPLRLPLPSRSASPPRS